MASVLNRRSDKGKSYSIQKLLCQYFKENTVIILCILLSCILSVSVIVIEYRQENESMLKLNRFYEDMREADALLLHYAFSEEKEDGQQILEKIGEIAEALDEVWEIPISSVFYRDIEDIRELYRNYYGNAQLICEYRMNEVAMAKIRSAYERAEKMAALIDRNFQSLYAQILHKGEEDAARQRDILAVCIVLLLLCISAGIIGQHFMTKKLSQNITEPIIQLTECIREVERKGMENAQTIALLPGTNDEVQILTDGYNAMLFRVKQQMKDKEKYLEAKLHLQEKTVENLKISNELKKAQYHMLQMQINPHFLFNTLNMISQTAMMEDMAETVELIHCMADYLRYILDFSDKSVSLKKELEMLGNYVYLQEKRFGDRIRICFDLDESFCELSVPCMILQPLVENAVVHGVGMYERDARIDIRTRRSEDGCSGIVSVIDNGVGMDAGVLERLKEDIFGQKPTIEKIGLSNVWRRLNLFFGDRISMDISSSKGKGTEITIVFLLE